MLARSFLALTASARCWGELETTAASWYWTWSFALIQMPQPPDSALGRG